RAPNITHLFGPSGYKAIFINAVFQSKLYQDSMVMIDTLSGKNFAQKSNVNNLRSKDILRLRISRLNM
ncbi:MAG: hypothetical protein LBD04_10925, partial [Synergistaceae bacterium]|nr:hypothetical protein [Synergistaceae bacterium]